MTSCEDAATRASLLSRNDPMKQRFRYAMLTYVVLAVLAGFTLTGQIRLVTLLVLGLFAFKTWLAVLRDRAD